MTAAPVPPLPTTRGPLGRDLLVRFVPLSIGLHLLAALPWHLILAALFKALGMGSSVHWKDVDAPTIIPIDIDQLGEDESAAPPAETTSPTTPGTDGVGTKPPPDGGVDGGDGGTDAHDGGPPDAKGDGEGDAPDADAGPKRVKDPNSAAGGLVGLNPIKGGEVNVSVTVRTDHMRSHPIGKQLGAKLAKIDQWKPFLAGTGIDPVMDLDAIYAVGPRFYETSRVTAILVHSKPDADIALALKVIADENKGEWIGDDDVPAFRAKIDGADRVFVQIPSGLIITPLDGEKQALAIAHAMVTKHKTGKDLLPKSDTDLIISSYMRQPSRVLSSIPEDLNDVHVTIRTRPDEGIVLDIDAKAKDAQHAEDDAKDLGKLIESHLTGLQGALVRKWVTGYSITTDGDVVHLHHELTGEQVQDIWALITTLGMF
jgi:hypothetical protein